MWMCKGKNLLTLCITNSNIAISNKTIGRQDMEKNRKIATVIAILANLSATITEILVLLKVVPYEIIGGGRIGSYEEAVLLAGFSTFVQICIIYCTAVASGILEHKKIKKIANVVLKVFIVYFAINIVMNLMGKTWFEKIYCSIICLVQIICFVIIIRKQK